MSWASALFVTHRRNGKVDFTLKSGYQYRMGSFQPLNVTKRARGGKRCSLRAIYLGSLGCGPG